MEAKSSRLTQSGMDRSSAEETDVSLYHRRPSYSKRLLSFRILTICILSVLFAIGPFSLNVFSWKNLDHYTAKEFFFDQLMLQQNSFSSPMSADQALSSSLMALSCFTTPHCFRRYKCEKGQPRKVKREGMKWEEMAFCTDDLKFSANNKQTTSNVVNTSTIAGNVTNNFNKASTAGSEVPVNTSLPALPGNQKTSATCLVYSFGILHQAMEWETKVSKLFGCEVHAFDPTVNITSTDYVHFHQIGLQGEGTDMAATHAKEYGAIDPERLFPLDHIMESLGHQDRTVDLLMLDCEGCEWGVLNQLICKGDGHMVKQLLLELHFQESLGLANRNDILIAGRAIQCLWNDGWGMVAQEKSGSDPNNAKYAQGVFDVLHDPYFLMYTALERLDPKTTLSLGDLWEDFKERRNKYPEDKTYYGNYFSEHSRIQYKSTLSDRFDKITAYYEEPNGN